ncbi:MAG: hypothetical protein LBC12_01845 [Nitrososphaerota archaeon]|jgi:hypothetical protein|nr:hypothetical protein [Nitrososphaerota archaeon]
MVQAQAGLTRYLDFSLSATNGDSTSGGTKTWIGNIFPVTTAFDPVIVSFRLRTSQDGVMPSDCEVIICSVVDNKPAEILFSMPFKPSGLPSGSTTQNWYNISLTGGFTMQAGTQYAILLRGMSPENTGNQPYLNVGLSSGNPKPSGWFTITGQYYNTGTVYPSTYLLNMQVYGLPAGATVPTDLSYTFSNVGTDLSQTQGNTITLNLNTINGNMVELTLPFGSSTAFSFAPLVSASWNYSDALNLVRVIEFVDTDGTLGGQQVFPLRTANVTVSVSNSYQFSVVDYTGSAQFVEISLGGQLIERRNIMMSGVADFSLIQGAYYTVSVVGTLGVFSQGFIAGSTLSSNLIVLAGSFGEIDLNPSISDVFFANRTSDNLGVNVFFSSVTSGSLNLTLSKLVGSSAVVVDSVSTANFPLNYVFSNAEPDVVYRVTGVLYDFNGGVVKSWTVDVAPLINKVNPWAALIMPFFGSVDTLPGSAVLPTGFDPAQLPVMVVLACFLAIFSWSNHEKGCLLCWVIALIMVGLGWFVVSVPAFGFALVLSIFIAFGEGKQREREI